MQPNGRGSLPLVQELLSIEVAAQRRAQIFHSTRSDGDLSPSSVDADTLAERREQAVGVGPWHAVHQVHGCATVVVDDSPPASPRPQADALVTGHDGQVLAVHSGDCVPIGLVHVGGGVAAVHAGWKGLQCGVIEAAATQLRAHFGDGAIIAGVGPHIRAAQYEFGSRDLEAMVEQFGEGVVATTAWGTPSLDLTAATVAELSRLKIDVGAVSSGCTAGDDDAYWSHRARSEPGRIALVAWLEHR